MTVLVTEATGVCLQLKQRCGLCFVDPQNHLGEEILRVSTPTLRVTDFVIEDPSHFD